MKVTRWVGWSLSALMASGCFEEGDITPATTAAASSDSSGPGAETSSTSDGPPMSSDGSSGAVTTEHGSDTTAIGTSSDTGSSSSDDTSSSSSGDPTSTTSTTDIPGSTTGSDSDPTLATSTESSGPTMTSEVGSGSGSESGPYFDVGNGGGFIVFADLPADWSCDPFAQDCPVGEKCMPWASDGGDTWNATRCTSVADDPSQPGDPCNVEGSATSGIDDCDFGAMCWGVDPITLDGVCIELCQGAIENPVCTLPEEQCVIANDGALTVCLPTCDPLLQDCIAGNGCYPVNDIFACYPEGAGAYADACESFNGCDPGLFCAGAAGCSSLCDTAAGNPDAQCGMGQSCVSWYAEGTAPPGYENVGGCVVP
jgi:hypothetical protein